MQQKKCQKEEATAHELGLDPNLNNWQYQHKHHLRLCSARLGTIFFDKLVHQCFEY